MRLNNFEKHPQKDQIMAGVKDLMRDIAQNFDDSSEIAAEMVSWKASEGFVPFTKGGVTSHFLLPVSESSAHALEKIGASQEAVKKIKELEENIWIDLVNDFAKTNNIRPEMTQRLGNAKNRREALELASAIAVDLDEAGFESFMDERRPFMKIGMEFLYNPDWAEKYASDSLMRIEINLDHPYFRSREECRASVGPNAPNLVFTLSETNFDLPAKAEDFIESARETLKQAFPNEESLKESPVMAQ